MIEIMQKVIHHIHQSAPDLKHDLMARTIDVAGKASLIGGASAATAEKAGLLDMSNSDWVFVVTIVGGLTLIIDRMTRLFFFVRKEKRQEKREEKKVGSNNNK